MLWSRVRATTICARRLGQERCDELRRARGRGCPHREPPGSTFRDGHATAARVAGLALRVIRQRPRTGWAMPCSVDDVRRVLSLVPRAFWEDLRVLVFRQPLRSECPVDACVWRWFFDEGTAIVINAVRVDEWRSVEGVHADVVRRAGGDVGGRMALFTREVARAFMLYHVLLHEIGHLVEGSDEMRAEQFALEWECRLRRAGAIPFAGAVDVAPRRTRRHGWRERIRDRVAAIRDS